MEGARRGKSLWKTMKQRLGFNAITLCGSSWGSDIAPNNVVDLHDQISPPSRRRSGLRPNPEEEAAAAEEGMNLAMALAAERGRNGQEEHTSGKTFRSLLGQLQDGGAGQGHGNGNGHDPARSSGPQEGFDSSCCCVCLERKKDAAFIPCGHTYCRVCSRELWLNRGCCPLCNRSITDVLDIF